MGVRFGKVDAAGAGKGATGGATGAGTVPCWRVDPKSEDKSEERLGRAELGTTGRGADGACWFGKSGSDGTSDAGGVGIGLASK